MRRLVIGFSIIVLLAAFVVLFYSLFKRREKQAELTLYGNVDVRQVDVGFRVQGQVTELCYEGWISITQAEQPLGSGGGGWM